jgi:hypothetical protein
MPHAVLNFHQTCQVLVVASAYILAIQAEKKMEGVNVEPQQWVNGAKLTLAS